MRRTLKSNGGRFASCYRLMSSPPAGTITVGTSFVIKSNGSVASARVVSSGGAPGDVQACIVRALTSVGFPPFRDEQMVVNYPIQLR